MSQYRDLTSKVSTATFDNEIASINQTLDTKIGEVNTTLDTKIGEVNTAIDAIPDVQAIAEDEAISMAIALG